MDEELKEVLNTRIDAIEWRSENVQTGTSWQLQPGVQT